MGKEPIQTVKSFRLEQQLPEQCINSDERRMHNDTMVTRNDAVRAAENLMGSPPLEGR
jgi:hypothetical protein